MKGQWVDAVLPRVGCGPRAPLPKARQRSVMRKWPVSLTSGVRRPQEQRSAIATSGALLRNAAKQLDGRMPEHVNQMPWDVMAALCKFSVISKAAPDYYDTHWQAVDRTFAGLRTFAQSSQPLQVAFARS